MKTEKEPVPIDFAAIYFGEGNGVPDQYPSARRKRMYAGSGVIRFIKSAMQFADWVRKIYIIAMDPLPEDPVLHDARVIIIEPSEFMPPAYVKTSNINAIELNLHRISGLSEQFVYFNAGTYLCGKTDPSFFFRNGLPCDYAIESMFETPDMYERHVLINDILQIKAKYNRNESLSSYRRKFYSPRYLKGMLQNVFFWFIRYWENGGTYRRGDFWGFEEHNYPLCTLKSICTQLWNTYSEALEATCSHLREDEKDADHSLIRFYQYASGRFSPCDWHSKTVQIDDISELATGKPGKYRIAVLKS